VPLAKRLGLNVLVEGVETHAQWDFILGVGCDLFQGYLFCHPQPARQIEMQLHVQLIVPNVPMARSAQSFTRRR